VLRAGSVWPAVIGHAAINGYQRPGYAGAARQPDTLLGPAPVGILGMAGWLIVAALILFNSIALAPKKPPERAVARKRLVNARRFLISEKQSGVRRV
jgi:hypothetical protein